MNTSPLIVLCTLCVIMAFLSTFVTETLNETLPINILAMKELLNGDTKGYFSLSKRRSDKTKNNLFITISKWNINSDDLSKT